VQYLAPFGAAFERRGRPVLVTARDTAITTDLLRSRGIQHEVIGTRPPSGRLKKLSAVGRRAYHLRQLIKDVRPSAVVCSSRPAAVAARTLGIPCFVLCDYEYAELGIYRRVDATIVHPDVVPTEHFEAQGFSRTRLIAFRGIKEDLSFAEVDVDRVEPFKLPSELAGLNRVLVRPPAETSHYFSRNSRDFVLALLDHLSKCDDAVVVFCPRHDNQIADVERITWCQPPVVLRHPVPFVSLLKGVDRVVSAGGTMLREAAYLGVPAYSLFGGKLGAVDEYLHRHGRLTLLRGADDLSVLTDDPAELPPFPRNPHTLEQLADIMLQMRADHGRPPDGEAACA
jgi:hypothetical protein